MNKKLVSFYCVFSGFNNNNTFTCAYNKKISLYKEQVQKFLL